MRSHDGTAIVWRSDGPALAPTVVLCNGITCSDHYWSAVVPALSETVRVVRWDYRGHGRSGLPASPTTVGVSDVVADLEAVLDAAAVPRTTLVGHSYGVQVVLEGYRRLPARVDGIVAVAGAPGEPLRRPAGMDAAGVVFGLAGSATAVAPVTVRRAWRRLWGSPAVYWLARALRGTSARAPRSVLRDYFAHVAGRNPDVLLGMFESMANHSATDVLATLGVPMLAIAGDADGLTPLAVMQDLVLTAPAGELVVIHRGSHTLPAEHPGRVAAEIRRFVIREGGLSPPETPRRSPRITWGLRPAHHVAPTSSDA